MAEQEVEVKDAPVENEPEAAKAEENKPEEATAEAPQEEATMRAVVLTGLGGYSKLKVEKRSKPKVTEGHVIVKVHACGQSFADLMLRQGMIPYFDQKPPYILGFECSGVIEEVGENVTDLEVGDRVCCMFFEGGAFAEYASAQAKYCFKMPESMSFEDGAAFLIPYLTAYFLLFYCGNVTRRKSVLIHNASGSLGVALTYLCKTVKGLTIFGTASLAKHEAIKNNGVDHAIDYRTLDYVEEIKKITPSVDLVLDSLGGHDTKKCYDLLSPLGALVIYGWANNISESKSLFAGLKSWFGGVTFNPLKLISDSRTVSGMDLTFVHPDLLREAMDELFKMYLDGTIKMPIDTTYAFEEIAQAHQRMHDRANIGKILLSPFKDPDPAAEPVKKRKKSFSKFHTEKPKINKRKAEEDEQDSDEKPAEAEKEGEIAAEEEKKEEEKKEDKEEKKEEVAKEEEKKEDEKKEEATKEEDKKEDAKEEEKKEEKQEEPKPEALPESKEETKEETKEEAKEETKEEVKEETKEEVKEETKEEAKEEPKEEAKPEETKSEEKAEEKVEPKEEPKEEAKEQPKEEAKEEEKKEESQETSAKKDDNGGENTEM